MERKKTTTTAWDLSNDAKPSSNRIQTKVRDKFNTSLSLFTLTCLWIRKKRDFARILE